MQWRRRRRPGCTGHLPTGPRSRTTTSDPGRWAPCPWRRRPARTRERRPGRGRGWRAACGRQPSKSSVGAGEGIALLGVAALVSAPEPGHALLGGAVGERLGTHGLALHALDAVVAHGGG